eukprot:1161287-Pelagomonas_calceolata.AAC.8
MDKGMQHMRTQTRTRTHTHTHIVCASCQWQPHETLLVCCRSASCAGLPPQALRASQAPLGLSMGMGMQHTPSQPQPGPTHHSNASAAAAATALHNLVSSSTVRTISRGSVQLCARVMRWHTALWWWGAWFPLPPSNELCKRGLALGFACVALWRWFC